MFIGENNISQSQGKASTPSQNQACSSEVALAEQIDEMIKRHIHGSHNSQSSITPEWGQIFVKLLSQDSNVFFTFQVILLHIHLSKKKQQ